MRCAKFYGIIIGLSLIISAAYSLNTQEFLDQDIAKMRNTREGCIALLDILSNKLAQEPDSYDLNWQYAAILYFQGDMYETNNNIRKYYFLKSKDYGTKAMKLNPAGIDGHFWLATGYGMYAEANGILDSLFCIPTVLSEMGKVISIQSNFFRGLPWGIRARTMNLAPGWPLSMGDKEKSYESIQEALKYGSDYRYIHQIYAEMLMNDGRYAEARDEIEKALNMPFEDRIPREENRTIEGLNKDMGIVNKKLKNRK